MGVVDFDPERWILANAPDTCRLAAKVANPANLGRSNTEDLQNLQDSQVASMPSDVRDGVSALRQMTAPHCVRVERWQNAVADTVALVDNGWAAKALALGWSPLNLFGAVTGAWGDPYSDGLAVWLTGRKVLAVSAVCVTVEDNGGRCYYTRRHQVGARPLWELR